MSRTKSADKLKNSSLISELSKDNSKVSDVPAKPKNSSSKGSPGEAEEITFTKEYWTGDSRDGLIVNGDGYHFYRMQPPGYIVEAYEFYEMDDGEEIVSPMPEMQNIHWLKDLGFTDFEVLDFIDEVEFRRIKKLFDRDSAA